MAVGKARACIQPGAAEHRDLSACCRHSIRIHFFAPNIPGYHKLIFELNYQDGRVEYESPHFSGKAAALRLDSLLARLGDNRYEPLREVVIKMLALSIWRERPDVKKFGPPSDWSARRASVILSMARANRSNRCSATISACVMRRSGSRTTHIMADRRYEAAFETHTAMILLRRQWQQLLEFLFPPETDTWLAVFRIGMGLQVVVYALFLRSDWHSLFSTTGKGLVSRELGEAIASFDSPLIPKLGWLVAFRPACRPRRRNSPFHCLGLFALHGSAVCCWDFSVARRRSLPGFFTSARLRAVDCLHTARTIS